MPMNEPARVVTVLKDFPGVMTKPDPDDLPVGAAHLQVNLTSQAPGQLRVRPGLRQLTFEDQ